MALGELKRNKPAKQSIRPSFQNFRSTLVPEPRLESPKASLEATTSILEFSRPENFKMALGELKRNKPAKQSTRPSFQNFRSTLVPEPRLESPKASLEATTSILEVSRPENFKTALGELKRNKPAKQSIRPSFQNFRSTLVPEPRLESPKASLEATTSILEFSRPENFKMALGELKRNKPAKQSIRPSFQNFRSTLVPEPRLESPKASLEATTSILEFSRPENFKMALGELKRNKPAKQSIRPSFQNFRSTLVPEPRLESPKASLEATTSILEFSRPENFKTALGELKRNKPAKQSIRPSFQNFRSTIVPEPRLESPKASLEATTSILEFSRPENSKMEVCCSLITFYHGFNGFGPNRGGDHTGETPTASLKATNSISEFSRPENSKMEVCCSLITVYHGFNGFGPSRGGDRAHGRSPYSKLKSNELHFGVFAAWKLQNGGLLLPDNGLSWFQWLWSGAWKQQAPLVTWKHISMIHLKKPSAELPRLFRESRF